MPKSSFLTDTQSLRIRARQHIEEGSVTAGYSADREMVLKVLNDSMATELVCVLRYRRQRIAIGSYRDIIQYLGNQAPTTRRMMEAILAVEEQHADELAGLLETVPEDAKGRRRAKHST